jgi:hypothetical protein
LAAKPARRRKVVETGELALVLARLGASDLSRSMNSLAEAARQGSLYADDLVTARLALACDDIRMMRELVMDALGTHANPVIRQARLSLGFNQAADEDPS